MGHSEYYEKKLNARIRLTAFAFNHNSEITSCEQRRPISLVNVQHDGARLRKQGDVTYCGLEVGDNVVLDLRLMSETSHISGRVAWISGEEVFVDFGSPLSVGMTDLQSALEN